MPSRVMGIVAWVAVVAALAAYVTTSGPADNHIVYGYHTQVDASVDVADPADEMAGPTVEVTVAGVSSRQLEEVELWGSTAAVVVTVTPTTDAAIPRITIDAHGATVTGRDEYTVEPAIVQGGDELDAGGPTVVTLMVLQPVEVMEGGGFNFASTTPTVPVEVTVPIFVSEEPIATVTAVLTPVPVTGDDVGIAGAVDIPDQRLPRPAVGDAIPTQLDDGRPVWVIGLDDTVAVLDARSPHRYSGLVGWCGSMPGFADSIGASRFTAAGEYRFGPAPHGLVPYAVEVADDHVTVTHRLPPSPRPQTPTDMAQMTPIEGSPVGPYCDIDTELAQLADGGPHLIGDLLVHRERGLIVDAASPPGTSRTRCPSGPAEPTTVTGRYDQTVRPDDGPRLIAIQPVMWVTSTGISPADTPPTDPDRHLVSTTPTNAYQLADDVEIDASPGDVVTLTLVGQQATDLDVRAHR